jgi:hypothetical protein
LRFGLRYEAKLSRLAGDVVNTAGATQELGSLLDRAAVLELAP